MSKKNRQIADIGEDFIEGLFLDMLKILLQDFTKSSSKKYSPIFLATDDYRHLGTDYAYETLRIIGVAKEKLFVYMDSITNAIAENCSPSIVPNIFFQAIGQKTVVVLEIQPGQNKPYFVRREGLTEGTYVRIGATTRRVTDEKLQELILFGKRLSFDEMPFGEKPAASADIESLCQTVKKFSKKNVTRKNLESWQLLVPYKNKKFPSNAFELLTKNSFTFAKIQCARFKGREKGLKEPSIEEKTESLLISLWRRTTQKTTQKLSNVEMQILELVRENAELSRGEIAEKLGNMTPDGVKYHLSNLQKKGALKRIGGRKFGSWIVLEVKK